MLCGFASLPQNGRNPAMGRFKGFIWIEPVKYSEQETIVFEEAHNSILDVPWWGGRKRLWHKSYFGGQRNSPSKEE